MKTLLLPGLHRLGIAAIEHASAIYAGISGARARFPDPTEGEFNAGRGRLTVSNRWRFLHLQGSPHECGVQQGTLLGALIRTATSEYLSAMRLFRGMSRRTLIKRGRRLERYVPGAYREEMHGIAQGAGMSYDDILLAHTFLEAVQATACSCYAAYGAATRGGRLVFGRNLDFLSLGIAHRCQVIAFHKPDNGIPFLSITWPGWCGVLTAVNMEGLCVGPLNVARLATGLVGQPYVILFRRIAQEARTCEEALALLRSTPRTFSNNVLLTQTQPVRRALVAEYTAADMAVREPREGDDFIAATNHFRKLGRKVEWQDDKGFRRYPTLVRTLRDYRGRIDLNTDVLAAPRVALPNNLHAFVAAPEERKFRLSLGRIPAANGPYRTFAYDETGIKLPHTA